MHDPLAHRLLEGHRFIHGARNAFTTRPDGSSWPNHQGTWRNTVAYYRALMRPGKRKNVTGLAKRVDLDQAALSKYVRTSPWEHQEVEAHLLTTVPNALQDPRAALIVDGMGIPKKGKHSVGVARQWCGATGKIDNCQMTVNLVLSNPGKERNADQVTWPLAMHLHLNKKWAGDDDSVYEDVHERERFARLREEAGIPDDVGHKTKPEIGLELVDAAIEAGIEHGCVVADSDFGKRAGFRERLRELDEAYVVEVEAGRLRVIPEDTQLLEPGPTPGRGARRKHPGIPDDVTVESPEQVAQRVDKDDAWRIVSWAEGTKGTIQGRFHRERVRLVTDASNGGVSDGC